MSSVNTFEFASCSDTLIWELYLSDIKHICFKSACLNNVFDIVDKMQPISRSDLISQAKYGKRGGEALINVITALGLLKCIDGNYFLTEVSKNYLTENAVHTWKPMFNIRKEIFEAEMIKIQSENYVNETGIINEWQAGEIDSGHAARFTEFMNSIHLSTAIGFAKNFGLKQFGVKSLLDVGGGSGCFSIAAAYHQPGVRAIILELESVCKVAQNFINKSGLEKDTVITYSANMFTDEFPSCYNLKYVYDSILFSNIFHDWGDEKSKYLAKKAYDALPKNGMIFLNEALLNDDGNGPLITACFSFHMFRNTEGKQFTFTELKNILTEAGFKSLYTILDIGVKAIYGIFSIVYGRKSNDDLYR